MPKLFNLARMTTATTGTGTVTLGSAVSGHISFASAGAVNNDIVTYGIIDGTAAEVGTGTYSSTGPTLTRTLVNSTTGALLNLSGSAEVFITDLASSHLPNDNSTIPGVFGLVKTSADVPIWARPGVYQRLFAPMAFNNNGSGAGTTATFGAFSPAGAGPLLTTGTTATGAYSLRLGDVGGDPSYMFAFQNNTLISGALYLIDAISDATNEYRFNFGIHEDWAFGGIGASAVYLSYDRATYGDHRLRAVTRAASTSTTTDTGVTMASQTATALMIEYVSSSLVRFYVNNSLVATHTTNIPATTVQDVPPAVVIKKTAGTAIRRAHMAQFAVARYF